MSKRRGSAAFSLGRVQRILVFAGICLIPTFVLIAALSSHTHPSFDAQHLIARFGRGNADLGVGLALGLAAAGAGIGLLGGTLGMGGGVLKVAGLLLIFRYDIHFARAVSIVTMFIVSVSAVASTDSPPAKRERREPVHTMMLAASVAVVFGVLIGNSLRGSTLTHIFGYFLLFLGFSALGQLLADPYEINIDNGSASAGNRDRNPARSRRANPFWIIGALHGLASGLLGISGGVVSLPGQQIFMGRPVKEAIHNALMITAASAGVGSILIICIAAAEGDLHLKLFLFVTLTIGVGAALGARLAVYLRGRIYASVLRIVTVALCLLGGISILV